MKQTLSELRSQRGMTQRDLARQLSISASAVALYELGLRTPSLHRAKMIAQFFGVAVEDILFGPAVSLRVDDQVEALDASGT